ncbi:MAG: 1-phosphofructokinase [Alphaproteobacteria bacterium]|jgi:1-phosphofructokinase|nr:1-phosphofructokinase [Alphaproteobacteria bacterium]
MNIYTLTLNPAVDYFLHVDNLKEGNLNLATYSNILVGGKGLNVSTVLANLSVANTATGFIGGEVGDMILRNLSGRGIKTDFIKVAGNTRINLKLYNQNTSIETEIAGVSPKISEEKAADLINKIVDTVRSEDILVLAGSIPNSISQHIYKSIAEQLSAGVKIILDTRGNCLRENLHNNFLIKPNKRELEEMFGCNLNSTEEIIETCAYFFENGAQNVIVSLGGEGSLCLNNKGVYKANPIKLNVKNTVGAGDSMVAGFIYGVSQNKTLEDCYKLAVSASLATIAGEGLATQDGINNFYNQVNIQQIK